MTPGASRTLTVKAVVLSLASPVVWSLHLLACYFFAALLQGHNSAIVRSALTLTTIVALSFLVAILLEAIRGYRRIRDDAEDAPALGFLFRISFWANGIFAVAVILTALPIYILGHLGNN